MLETRHFIIFTDHKHITYAFQQKLDRCSPRQFNHLDFIAQFTSDIYLDRTTLSPTLSLVLNPSPRHHLMMLWPHRGRQPVSFTSILISWGLFQRQQTIHTASLQLTASRAGQKQSPSQTSQPTPWHAPYWPAGYATSVALKPSPPTRDVSLSHNSPSPWPDCAELN
jgi:hypothetical protein